VPGETFQLKPSSILLRLERNRHKVSELYSVEVLLAKIENVQTVAMPFAAWGRLAANSAAHMNRSIFFNGVIVVVVADHYHVVGFELGQAGALASARTLLAGVGSFRPDFLRDLAGRRNLFTRTLYLDDRLCHVRAQRFRRISPWLMVYMALGGFGGGGFHPQSLAILSAKYREQKAFVLGVHDSSANLGGSPSPPRASVFFAQFL